MGDGQLFLYALRRWTRNVKLADPVAYAERQSFFEDEEIILRIHSSTPLEVTFNRMDRGGFSQLKSVPTEANVQSRKYDHWKGFRWSSGLRVSPGTLSAGFYRVDLVRDGAVQWKFPLIVRKREGAPVVVIASTNTWNAYNDFGGLSNYGNRATPYPLRLFVQAMTLLNLRVRLGERHWIPSVPLPERRPNTALNRDFSATPRTNGHLAAREAVLIGCLERDGVDYTILSDRDFATDPRLREAKLLVFNTHSEYWSDEMLGRLATLIRRGTSVAFLSGNNAYRKVQLLGAGISVIHQIVPPAEVTPLIGACYSAAGYLSNAPYAIVDRQHWCFDGVDPQVTEFGAAAETHDGASGYETDKISVFAPDFNVLAIGTNQEGPAYMVCRDHANRSFVFNAGSVAFTASLASDPVAQSIVRNIVRRALSTGGVSAAIRSGEVPD